MPYNEIAAAVGCVLIVLIVVSSYNFYMVNMYAADIAKSQLSNVKAQTDLTNIKVNLNNALSQLKPYHGNPGLLKEDPYQNYDVMKSDIQQAVNNINKYVAQYGEGSDSNYAYQQTIQNTKNSAEQIIDRISSAGSNWFTNPLENGIFYVLLVSAILSPFVIIWGSDVIIQNRRDKEYYERYNKPRLT